jgi:hypothetical protein
MISSPPKKTPSFGRFANQNKKDLQVRSTPLRKKEKIYIIGPSQCMGKKSYFNTSTFMNCDKK